MALPASYTMMQSLKCILMLFSASPGSRVLRLVATPARKAGLCGLKKGATNCFRTAASLAAPKSCPRECWTGGTINEDRDMVFKFSHGGVLDSQVKALGYELDEGTPSHREGLWLIGPSPQRRRPVSKLGGEFQRRSGRYASQIRGPYVAEEVGVEILRLLEGQVSPLH
jgi:hypothetical protein